MSSWWEKLSKNEWNTGPTEAGMLCTGDEFFSKSTCLSVLSGNSHFSYGQFGTLTLTKWSLFFKAGVAFDAILQCSQKKERRWSDEGRKPVVHTFGNRRWASEKHNNWSGLSTARNCGLWCNGHVRLVMWARRPFSYISCFLSAKYTYTFSPRCHPFLDQKRWH